MSTGAVKAKQQEKTVNDSERPTTYDHIKSSKKPITRTVWLCLDSELGDELSEAQQALSFAEIDAERHADNPDVRRRLQEAKARAEKANKAASERSIKFVFRSIGRKKYEDIIFAHGPTDAQKEQAADRGEDPDNLMWDPDEFPPALIAASLVEPDLSAEQVMEIYNSEDWSPAELGVLFNTAQAAQSHASVVELGKG